MADNEHAGHGHGVGWPLTSLYTTVPVSAPHTPLAHQDGARAAQATQAPHQECGPSAQTRDTPSDR